MLKNIPTRFILWILIEFNVSFTCVSAELIAPPQNTAVESGQRVELSCESNTTTSDLIWWYRDGSTANICSCRSSPPQPGYSCYNSTGMSCNLIIENVTPDQAGEYQCEGIGNPAEKYKAQLVVLSTPPQCHTSPSDRVNITDSVEMSCSVTYTGSLAPVMTWFNPQGDELRSSNQGGPGSSNYVTSVIAEIPNILNHRCDTKFITAPPPGAGSGTPAINIPSYTSTCYTQIMIVQYPPFKENVTIEGFSEDIYLGSTLTCRAETEPAVFLYEWSDNRGETVGSNYTLSLDQTGQNLNYTCTVCNLLGCNQVTINVNVVPVPATTTTTTDYSTYPMTSTATVCNCLKCNSVGLGVGLGLGLGIPLLISFMVIGYFIWKTRTKRSNTDNKSSKHCKDLDKLNNLHEADQKLSDTNEDQSHGYVNVNFSVTSTEQQNQTTAIYEQLNSPPQQINEYEKLHVNN